MASCPMALSGIGAINRFYSFLCNPHFKTILPWRYFISGAAMVSGEVLMCVVLTLLVRVFSLCLKAGPRNSQSNVHCKTFMLTLVWRTEVCIFTGSVLLFTLRIFKAEKPTNCKVNNTLLQFWTTN